MKAEQERLPRFAVLIDADNTSPQIVGGLFEEVAKFGEASVRRILRGFFRPAAQIVGRHPAKARHRPLSAVCLHQGQERVRHCAGHRCDGSVAQWAFDGFCLVSSDSDFTRLASRLREQGADVYGFGAQ